MLSTGRASTAKPDSVHIHATNITCGNKLLLGNAIPATSCPTPLTNIQFLLCIVRDEQGEEQESVCSGLTTTEQSHKSAGYMHGVVLQQYF